MEVDDEEIPSAKVPPSYQLLSISTTDIIVVFDVEITGLGKDCQITQLAACRLAAPSNKFAQYVLLTVDISKEGSRVTNLSIGRVGGR